MSTQLPSKEGFIAFQGYKVWYRIVEFLVVAWPVIILSSVVLANNLRCLMIQRFIVRRFGLAGFLLQASGARRRASGEIIENDIFFS